MDMVSLISGLLLMIPPIVIGTFWWISARPGARRGNGLPDGESIVLARAGGVACALLPVFQIFAGVLRYRTGALGRYVWYAVPGLGLLLALFVIAAFLSYARGSERRVSSAMVLLSVCTLLLLTLLGPDV